MGPRQPALQLVRTLSGSSTALGSLVLPLANLPSTTAPAPKITTAAFVTSSPSLAAMPTQQQLPEFALLGTHIHTLCTVPQIAGTQPSSALAAAGHSNAGKSSLLNMLMGRGQLAHTGKTPGKTTTCANAPKQCAGHCHTARMCAPPFACSQSLPCKELTRQLALGGLPRLRVWHFCRAAGHQGRQAHVQRPKPKNLCCAGLPSIQSGTEHTGMSRHRSTACGGGSCCKCFCWWMPLHLHAR